MIGCTETITLVRHNKDDDTYKCVSFQNCSWFEKTTITTDGNGAKPVNTYIVRVFDDTLEPHLGDYVVKGTILEVKMPSDLKNYNHFRVTALADNRRKPLPHWSVSGQ